MGRGVSSGGGQSSLGYLFGNGEAPKSAAQTVQKLEPAADNGPPRKLTAAQPIDISKQIPAGIQGNKANNYFRAEGQNCGNFITVCTDLSQSWNLFCVYVWAFWEKILGGTHIKHNI